ncbi:MAG: DUF4956 domain-containing protein [Acidobacteria bacterium]|nr:DUF4956 domain-containing protein [Acidobacteriota bacterium]
MPEFLTKALSDGQNVDPLQVFVRLLAALILGWVVSWIYSRTTHADDAATSLPTTLVLLSVLIAMVTQVIGDSVARAFSLVGALSIVRFRTVVRDTRDTAFVIFAVIVGMAIGSQHPWVAVLGILVGGGASFLLAKRQDARAVPAEPGMVLRLRASLGTDLEPLMKQVSGGGAYRLLSLATAKQGTSIEAAYEIRLDKDKNPEELVKQLHRMDGIHDVRLTVRGADTE